MKTSKSVRSRLGRLVAGLIACLSAGADVRASGPAFPPTPLPGDRLYDFGSMQAKPWLGWGWSFCERSQGRDFRWIKSMEADLSFELAAPSGLRLWIEAAPAYLAYTRQSVAIYVNGDYITRWTCNQDIHFATYRAEIPRRFTRSGVNRLTLRMGYRKTSPFDPRRLSLCVDRLLLRPTR